MKGQAALFILFILTLIAGLFAYFIPRQPPMNPLKYAMDFSGFNGTEQSNIKKSQQLNITTDKGILKVRQEIDDIIQEQKKIEDMIKDEQQGLQDTDKQVSDLMRQEGANSGQDALRLKALGMEIQDDQRLLVVRGQALINLNNQLTQTRQLLSQQRDVVNINTESSFQSLHDHNVSLNDQSSFSFDKVKQQNDDALQRSRDSIDQERQKAQDQQDQRNQ